MAKKTILFVDDESNILSGFKRMLRSMRKTMDFQFAESGVLALEVMAEHQVDVVVSDMRMPGMDGVTLLSTIQEQYPHAIRIMLTGHADNEAILRTVDVVHQFLSKPFDPEILKQVIDRACALQDLMADESLKELVSSIGSLPSLPKVYAELQKKMKDPECSIADVAGVIEKDMGMCTKVLQLVNSAFFGLFTKVDSPARAVNLLGLDTIKTLVLGMGVFSELKSASSKGFSVDALWQHSLSVAAFAKKIALEESDNKELIDNCYIAGMIHDVGKLLLFSSLPDKYIQAVTLAMEEQELNLSLAEQKVFQADHGDVGGYLIGLWGLPGSVVEAIAFHHKLDDYPEPTFCPALAVHVADVLYYRLNPQACIGAAPVLNEACLEQVGLTDRVEHWLELCREIDSQQQEEEE